MKREPPYPSQALSTRGGVPSPVRWHLERILAELRVSREETHSIRRDGEARRAPSRDTLETILNDLTELLFPRHYGRSELDGENIDYFVGNTLGMVLDLLCDQIHRGPLFVGDELLPVSARDLLREAIMQADLADRHHDSNPVLGATNEELFAAASFIDYRSDLRSLVDIHADADALLKWSEASAFGNFLDVFTKSDSDQMRSAFTRLVESKRIPEGLRLERYLRFAFVREALSSSNTYGSRA